MFNTECIDQRPAPANGIHLRYLVLPILNGIEVVALHDISACRYRELDRDVGSEVGFNEIRILANFVRLLEIADRIGIGFELA